MSEANADLNDPAVRIMARVEAFLRQRFGREDLPLRPDTDLRDGWLLDSLDLTHLVLHLEETFDLRLTRRDLDPSHFRTLERIATFVLERRPDET